MIASTWHSGKGETIDRVKKINQLLRGVEGGRKGWIGEAQRAVWYYNDGHVSLYICQNP